MICPICGKAGTAAYRPFCSRRCADVDLGHWLTEGYRIPATREEDPDDGATEAPPPKPQ
jgi:endogenous inhibitor of DNA gyrase (YacG/DUF329 family)